MLKDHIIFNYLDILYRLVFKECAVAKQTFYFQTSNNLFLLWFVKQMIFLKIEIRTSVI